MQVTVLLLAAALTLVPTIAPAQPRAVGEAECRDLRARTAKHAALSDGVRRLLAGMAGPAAPPAAAASAPADRGGAIRTRLAQLPGERQALEEQRLGAMVQFNFARAAEIQNRMAALEEERGRLERELAGLPAASSAVASPPPAAPARPVADVDRLRCPQLPAAYEAAVKTRQKELGAKEGQPGALPLVALQGRDREQIARELAGQFAAWPEAASQIGLLDGDGDGRLDGFVDVPAEGVFRLFRQRSDGTLAVEAFDVPGRPGAGYGELTRRLDESSAQQARRTLADLLAIRPAGPARTLAETAGFALVQGHVVSGNFAEAAKADGGTARTREFENLRGERVRMLELIAPVPGGVVLRRVVVVGRPGDQEAWEETVTTVRPASYWRTDVEVSTRRETRAAAGAGAPAVAPTLKFSLER